MNQLFQSLPLIPPALRPVFYALAAGSLVFLIAGTWSRLALWHAGGRPSSGEAVDGRGIAGLLWLSLTRLFSLDCLLARRVAARSRLRAAMLVGIIWGALTMVAAVLSSAVDYLLPRPLLGDSLGGPLALWLDVAGLALLLGLAVAMGRRYLFPPERWIGVAYDGLILVLLGLIVLLGFVVEGLRLAGAGFARAGWWPVGSVFGWVVALAGGDPAMLDALYTAAFLLHAGLALVLIGYLPFSRLFHLLAAQITTAVAAREGR